MSVHKDFQGVDPVVIALALHAAEDAIVITLAEPLGPEPHPKIVFVSDGYTRMTGYQADDLIGRSPRTSQGAGTDRATFDRIRTSMERWEPCREEVLNYKKDGTPFWVELDIHPVVRDDGWVTHWISIQRDITARRLNQATVLRQAKELDHAYHRAQMGVWRWEVGSGRITCSAPASGIVALPLNGTEVSLADAVEAIAAPDRDHVQSAIDSVAATGSSAEFKLQLLLPGKEPRSFWADAHAESADDGRVRAVFGLWQDITDRQQLEAELHQRATHDLLTALPNRDAALASGAGVVVRSKDEGLICTVALFDVDNLEDINRAYGIAVGDLVVKTVATQLQRACPTGSAIGRFGSNQFLMINAFAGQPEAKSRIHAIQAKLAEPIDTSVGSIAIGVRAAAARFEGPVASLEETARHAGIALSQGQESGRSSVTWYNAQMGQIVEERTRQLSQLNSAISNGHIVPFYQPMIKLNDGDLLGFEALMRVELHGDFLPPAKFHHALDDLATLRKIGTSMIDAVLRQIQSWNDAAVAFGAVSINLSVHDLRQIGFAEDLLVLMGDHGVRPDQLQIEVTEDALVNVKDDEAVRQLGILHRAGLHIALDDFGTGYASLRHLQSLPVTSLKIDRAFIKRIGHSSKDDAIVSAMASIGRAMGLKAVAEGVETAEQAVAAHSFGCTAMQGWFSGQAMPAVDAEHYIREWPRRRRTLLQSMRSSALRTKLE